MGVAIATRVHDHGVGILADDLAAGIDYMLNTPEGQGMLLGMVFLGAAGARALPRAGPRGGPSQVATGARLPQDSAVFGSPAPAALPLTRPIGRSPTQYAALQARIRFLIADGATDFRVNQRQVNIDGVTVGINRPDLQYTLRSVRVYEEFETQSLGAAYQHLPRIRANDPLGQFIPWYVP